MKNMWATEFKKMEINTLCISEGWRRDRGFFGVRLAKFLFFFFFGNYLNL